MMRFDDAMLREQSESRVLPKGSDSSKVRLGKVGGYDLGEEVIAALNVKWQEIVMPVTGFGSYKELIASLAPVSSATLVVTSSSGGAAEATLIQ